VVSAHDLPAVAVRHKTTNDEAARRRNPARISGRGRNGREPPGIILYKYLILLIF
jgi:hypothetical protein